MSEEQSLELRAYAKVNLGLAVIARRGDGYHEVETWMARVSLADVLGLTLSSEPGVALSVRGDDDLPTGPENLAVRAAEAYLRRWGKLTSQIPPGVRISLTKRIPVAAGLGGGSSDAGATLRGLAELLPLPQPSPSTSESMASQPSSSASHPRQPSAELARLAASLGSDVPFFAADMPFAIAKGRGERLSLAPSFHGHLVLVNPGLEVSAADAYGALVGFSPRLKAAVLAERLAAGAEPRWHNALQAGVQRAHPVIRDVVSALKHAGLAGAMMSGSGSTCFGVARSEEHARDAVESLAAERPEWWVQRVVTG